MQIVKYLFSKVKEEGKDVYKCFDDIPQYPSTGSLQLPMQILQGRSTRSDSPMSNAPRKQFGIQPEVLRNIDKYEMQPTNDLHVGQHVIVSRQCK